MLAKQPTLITKIGEINYNYGKDFNNWFNDRFNFRSNFISIDSNNRYKLASKRFIKNEYYIDKKDLSMGKFYISKIKPYSTEEINITLRNVSRLQEFCKARNIRLYILIAPLKYNFTYSKTMQNYNIYSEYKNDLNLKQSIESKLGVPVIYPYEEISKLPKWNAYFKTDHHWTDEGAYVAYLQLMHRIKKDFPNIYINKPEDFDYTYSKKVRVKPEYYDNGGTYNAIGIKDKYLLKKKYKYFKHKQSNLLKKEYFQYKNRGEIRNYEIPKKAPKLVLYGDSYTFNLLQSIVYSFSKTKNIFIPFGSAKYEMSNLESIIENFKPDLLVLCFCNSRTLLYLYE